MHVSQGGVRLVRPTRLFGNPPRLVVDEALLQRPRVIRTFVVSLVRIVLQGAGHEGLVVLQLLRHVVLQLRLLRRPVRRHRRHVLDQRLRQRLCRDRQVVYRLRHVAIDPGSRQRCGLPDGIERWLEASSLGRIQPL